MPGSLQIVRLNSRTFPITGIESEILAPLNAELVAIEGSTDSEIIVAAQNCDAMMVVSAYVRGPVIESLKRCKIISRMGTGIDKIDIAAAARKKIFVTNCPGMLTNEVADHTMALLLSAARLIRDADIQMRLGKQSLKMKLIGRLAGQNLGIIGFGAIGRAVAIRAQAFGMNILANDPCVSAAFAQSKNARLVDLDTILAESDYLSLLCPLTESTRRMLTLSQFKKMKPTAVLVNTGRGELVDEADMVIALKTGLIRYAALDVFEGINVFREGGFATTHDLFLLDNVLMTPHIAACSKEAMEDVPRISAQAVVDVLTGKKPKYPVNMK
ncbi:MAG: C-terminal binding protein [Sedimentisphaerales bacterium]